MKLVCTLMYFAKYQIGTSMYLLCVLQELYPQLTNTHTHTRLAKSAHVILCNQTLLSTRAAGRWDGSCCLKLSSVYSKIYMKLYYIVSPHASFEF